MPCEVSKKTSDGLETGLRHQHQVLRRAGLFQQFANQRFQRGMHAHAVDLARLQFRKRRLDQPAQGIRIHGHFAMDHACGNRDRQVHQVLDGFLTNVFPQAGQRAERLRQALHGGTKLFFGLLASGRQTFGVSFTPRLIQLAGRFALRIGAAIAPRVVHRRHHTPQYRRGGRNLVGCGLFAWQQIARQSVARKNLRRHIRRRRLLSGSACLRSPVA